MRKILLLLFILLLLLFSCNRRSSSAEAPYLVLSYADNQAVDFPTSRAAEYFANLVYERTEGRVKILVYPEAMLGAEASVFEQMKYGGIDFARFSLGILSDYYPMFGVLELPYLYEDSEHMWRVLDGEIGDYFLEYTKEFQAVALAWLDAGSRSFYTRRPVETLEDFKDLTIRVQETDLMVDIIERLGSVAVKISYGDIYSALLKKEIDGAENNLPSYVHMGHYVAAPYFYLSEHFRLPEVIAISQSTIEKLNAIDPAIMDVIRECAREAGLYERKLWAEEETAALETVLASDCVVTVPDQAEIERIKEAMRSVYDDYLDYSDLIERIRNQ